MQKSNKLRDVHRDYGECFTVRSWCHFLKNLMALVFSNVSLERYDGSRSQKSYDNVRRMLSMVYFHGKTIRNAANIPQIVRNTTAKAVILGHKNLKKVPRNPGGTGYKKGNTSLVLSTNKSEHFLTT